MGVFDIWVCFMEEMGKDVRFMIYFKPLSALPKSPTSGHTYILLENLIVTVIRTKKINPVRLSQMAACKVLHSL